MNSYPSYKDSGVEWMGKIPSSWSVKRNKYITIPKKDKSEDGSEELLSVSEYLGVVPRSVIRKGEDHLTRSESLEGYLKVSKGDLVNNIMLMWKKGLGVSKYDGIVSPSYSVFSFNESIPTYHHYLFRTDLYITEFRKNSTGIIQSRLRLYDDDFGFIYSYLPPLPEQKQIVSFLDTKTQKIDELIEKTEQKIELLKEKRTSLINHCVTKGLNPDVEMKDSGVEWIGEIPSDWDKSQFKYFIKLRHGHQFRDNDFTDSGVKIIKITQLDKKGFLNISNCSKIDEKRLGGFEDILIKENDILMCLTGGTIGKIIKVGKVDEPLLQNYRVGHFSPLDSEIMGNDYMFYLMSSEVIVKQIFFDVRETGQPNIGMEDMNRMRICIPPLEEQSQIVEYLDEQTQNIDSTIEKETKRTELLKEYRQSLISEVVTGKVDVSEWKE